MNKNKNRLLVQCFMKMLQQRIERDKVETLSPVFGNILSKEELQNILKWLYLNKVPEHYDLETMSRQDLLEAIGDDIHILSYSIEKWKKELEEKGSLEKKTEMETAESILEKTDLSKSMPKEVYE